ncbi:hypothetical protein ACET3Z_022274 [Daucus carota]
MLQIKIVTEPRAASTISVHLNEIQRQLEEQKVEQLNMAELNRMEQQLEDLLQRTRSTKEQAMRNSMSLIHEKDKVKEQQLLKNRLPNITRNKYSRLTMTDCTHLFGSQMRSSTTTAAHD